MAEVTTTLEKISPDTAKQYLTSNLANNRRIKKELVKFYSRMMTEGKWQLNGSTIVFDKNGSLIDGQHRLLACIDSNTTLEILVTRGVEQNSFYTIDTGYSRSNAQTFGIMGIRYASQIASAINRFLKIANHSRLSVFTTSGLQSYKQCTQDLLSVYEKDPEYWHNLISTCCCMYKNVKLLTVTDVASIIALLNKEKHYEYSFVMDFFEQLFYEEKTKAPVIRQLRHKLIEDMISSKKMTNTVKEQLIIKTWEYYKKGESPKRLQWINGVEEERQFE